MGRHSGFIASPAALTFADVNVCLVPEVPFRAEALLGNQHFTHVPLGAVTSGQRQLLASGELWQRVLQATGQPPLD